MGVPYLLYTFDILRCLIRLFYQVSNYQWTSLVAQLVKSPFASAGDVASIPGSGRFPGEGNGNPLKHSCLGNPIGRGSWQAAVHGVTRVGHDLVTKPLPLIINIFVKFLWVNEGLELLCYFANITSLISFQYVFFSSFFMFHFYIVVQLLSCV